MYDCYDPRSREEQEADEREFKELMRPARETEIKAWEIFIATLPSTHLRTVFIKAYDHIMDYEYAYADEILLDNYKVIAKNPDVEAFIESRLTEKGMYWRILHPRYEKLWEQIKLSKAAKPQVGDLIPRYIMASKHNGLYRATPAVHSHSDNGAPIIRVMNSSDGWCAVDMRNGGIVTYLEEEPKQDWSHLEITQVNSRSCKAIARCVDFNELVKKEVIDFQKLLGEHGKIRVEINWR